MLVIEQTPLNEMLQDGLQTFPDECCGFFFGKETGEGRIILKSLVVNNSKEGDKRRRFEISPKDYLNAERFADENELQLWSVNSNGDLVTDKKSPELNDSEESARNVESNNEKERGDESANEEKDDNNDDLNDAS